MASLQQLIDEGIIDGDIEVNGPASVACFDELFGEDQGLDEAIKYIMFGPDGCLDALQSCVKQWVVDCLLDPETSPLTKDFIGSIFQDTIGTEEGLDSITDTTGESPITFQGIKIKTIALARKAVAIVRGE